MRNKSKINNLLIIKFTNKFNNNNKNKFGKNNKKNFKNSKIYQLIFLNL